MSSLLLKSEVPEVGDGDDDEQVEDGCEQRCEVQQRVNERSFSRGVGPGLPA